MFGRILIPVDFSDRNLDCISQASALALDGAHVTLLHIIERIAHLEESENQEFYARLETRSKEKMKALLKRCAELDLKAEPVISLGKRVGDIVGYAMDNQMDLIVMHSPRFDFESGKGALGTTSHQVAMLAQCSVFLVK